MAFPIFPANRKLILKNWFPANMDYLTWHGNKLYRGGLENGLQEWAVLPFTLPDYSPDNNVQLSVLDENSILLAFRVLTNILTTYIYVSIDKGKTWNLIHSSESTYLPCKTGDGEYVFLNYGDDEIYKGNASSYSKIYSQVQNEQFSSNFCSFQGKLFAGGLSAHGPFNQVINYGLFRSDNGGSSWNFVFPGYGSNNPDTHTLWGYLSESYSLFATDQVVLLLTQNHVTDDVLLLRSTDGANWSPPVLTLNLNDPVYDNPQCWAKNPTAIFLATQSQLFISEDSGISFRSVPGGAGSVTSSGQAGAVARPILTEDGPKVQFSNDNGITWQLGATLPSMNPLVYIGA